MEGDPSRMQIEEARPFCGHKILIKFGGGIPERRDLRRATPVGRVFVQGRPLWDAFL